MQPTPQIWDKGFVVVDVADVKLIFGWEIYQFLN